MEKNFFDYLTNISLSQRFFKRLAVACVLACVTVPLVMFVIYTQNLKIRDQTIWLITGTGEVMSAEAGQIQQNRALEAEAHARLFVRLFFNIDRFTKDQNISAAYDLGNSCIHNLYTKMSGDGWFSKFEQYNIRQSVIIEQAECVAQNPYQVRIRFRVQITSEATAPMQHQVVLLLRITDPQGTRTRNNPHALWIENIDVENFS